MSLILMLLKQQTQTLVTPGRRFIFEGAIQQLDDKKSVSQGNKLEAPRPSRHKRNRSMGSLAISQIIVRDKDRDKDREKDNTLPGGSNIASTPTKKKYVDRYCFIFDDAVVIAKRTNIGTLLSEPGSALMFFTKKTKSKFRNDRKVEMNWGKNLGGTSTPPGSPGPDDEPPADSFQFHRYILFILFYFIYSPPSLSSHADASLFFSFFLFLFLIFPFSLFLFLSSAFSLSLFSRMQSNSSK